MNTDLKKVIGRVKNAQSKLQVVLKKQDWVEEARKYAERQGTEVKKLLSADLDKVKVFIERERKELERFQKQIPGEVKKLKSFVQGQRKELSKILAAMSKSTPKRTKRATKGTTKKKSTSKASSS